MSVPFTFIPDAIDVCHTKSMLLSIMSEAINLKNIRSGINLLKDSIFYLYAYMCI